MDVILDLVRQQVTNAWETLQEMISIPKRQRRLIMIIVCIALLLDNMLYMVIVSGFVLSAEIPCRCVGSV